MEHVNALTILTKCIDEFIDAYRKDLAEHPREGGVDTFWKDLFFEVYFVGGVRCRYANGDEMGDLMVKLGCHYGGFKALEKAGAKKFARLVAYDCEDDVIEKVIVCDRTNPVFLGGCFYDSRRPGVGRANS